MIKNKLRIVALSDTHCMHKEVRVPNGDVLIHAGDFTSVGRTKSIIAFNHWMSGMPHKYKICIAGNHDTMFEQNPYHAESLLTDVIYLRDKLIEIEGRKIYGTPWQPAHANWAFNVKRGSEIKKKWDLIPNDLDILIVHGPPYGILDKTEEGHIVGCEELAIAVNNLKPKFCIFGHIHEGYGIVVQPETTFMNVSICNRKNKPANNPIVFDI